jgi:hypothetical protein
MVPGVYGQVEARLVSSIPFLCVGGNTDNTLFVGIILHSMGDVVVTVAYIDVAGMVSVELHVQPGDHSTCQANPTKQIWRRAQNE